MIPCSIIVTGDLARGRGFIGYAKTHMDILSRSMQFQKLNEGHRTLRPYPGVVVECWASFSFRQIKISVEPPTGMADIAGIKKKQERECFCFPHFSFGIILKTGPSLPLVAEYEYPEDYTAALAVYRDTLLTSRFQYDVEICAKEFYLVFEGAYDANFGVYVVGQFVLVSIGDEMTDWDVPLDCDRECLVNLPKFEELIIAPFHIAEQMVQWFDLPETRKRL